MPHVVLEGEFDLETYWKQYQPLRDRTPAGEVLKTAECWLNTQRKAVLVDCLTVEMGITRHFYVLVSDKGAGRCTIHLDALTQPEPADSVKRIIVRLAMDLLKRFPGLKVGATNLQTHFPAPA